MKGFEHFEAAWRDGVPKQCIYGFLLGVVMMLSIQIGLIQPKADRVRMLSQEIMRLNKLTMQINEEQKVNVMMSDEKACPWEKNEAGWRMSGEFESVYSCILHQENTRVVASMRLQKHIKGVSVVLGFNEMPA